MTELPKVLQDICNIVEDCVNHNPIGDPYIDSANKIAHYFKFIKKEFIFDIVDYLNNIWYNRDTLLSKNADEQYQIFIPILKLYKDHREIEDNKFLNDLV